MQTIIISFKDTMLKNNTFEVKANVVSATESAIQRVLAKEKKVINQWLLAGKALMNIYFEQTGEVIATGWYKFNVFASRGEYQFKMER